MVAATKSGRRVTLVSLREDVMRLGKPERIDREAGILYGVKVLGLESLNGRRYTLEAIQAAKTQYERLAVNVDHPAKPADQRSAYDRIGWLENVQVKADGLYADLHLLTSHELTPKLLEAALKNSNLFGLSHNASGEGQQQNDTFVVGRILEVVSVDLVADPATTKGLWESRQGTKPMKKAIKAVLESVLPALSKPRQAVLKKLLEDGMMQAPLVKEMDEPMPPEAGGEEASVDPMDALAQGFKAAIMAILDDTTLDAGAKAKKIGDFLKTHEKLTAVPEPEPEPEVAEGEGEPPADDGKVKEGRQSRPANLTEARAKQFCKLAGVNPDAELIEAMKAGPEETALKLLEWAKGKTTTPARSGPRSQPPGSAVTTPDDDASYRQAVERLTGRPVVTKN